MVSRRAAAAAAAEAEARAQAEAQAQAEPQEAQDGGSLVKLKFKDPLTWRPGHPIPTAELLKRLDRLSKELTDMDQDMVDVASLIKINKDVASHQLLTHKDKGVRAYAACCVVDLLRLCAPDAPFTPSQLKDIFNLSVNSIIPALFDPLNPYNNQHRYVLRSFAEIKSIVLLLDVEGSENLLLQLFSTIFDGVSGAKSSGGEQILKDVEFSMQDLLGPLIEDSGSLPPKVVDVIMAQFLRAAAGGGAKDKQDQPLDDTQGTLQLKEEPEAYQMAKNLCHLYPDKMSRCVSQYFSDVIMDATSFAKKPSGHKDDEDEDEDGRAGGPSEADLKELRKAHTLIREVWKAAPMILQNVVPQLETELAADNIHLRQLATETLGDMISGIGAAGPPPAPALDPTAYPPLRMDDDDRADPATINILTTPLSSISFSQTHPSAFHGFMGRKNDRVAAIRAAWTSSAGYIISTSAGGIGLSREEETRLIQGLTEKLVDPDDKVRVAAVKAIASFRFQDLIMKLGTHGGVGKEGSLFATLAERCRDKKAAVRVAGMSLLGKLWAVGAGEMLAGNEAVVAALGAIPNRIINTFYANDQELNILLDRVIYECLVPLNYPPAVKKGPKPANGNSKSQSQPQPQPQSQSQAADAAMDPDAIRAQRILLLTRSLNEGGKKAFFAMQAKQPQFAKYLVTFLQQCEQYNGGIMDENAVKKTANLDKTIRFIAQFLPDDSKHINDLMKFARMNNRQYYSLVRHVIGPEFDFKTVQKALTQLVKRIQSNPKEEHVLDTLLPLLYRSGCLMFNRSHLSTIMSYSKTNRDGLGGVAHEILNEMSQRNPDLFKTHIGQLCKDLMDQAPTATKANDPVVAETMKACSTYARRYPKDVPSEKRFAQTMVAFALYGQPAKKAAKYAVNILLSGARDNNDRAMLRATDLLQRTVLEPEDSDGWNYGAPHFLNKLAIVSQLELLAPTIAVDAEDQVLKMAVQQILLTVKTKAKEDEEAEPDWVDDADLDEEIQAKLLALKTLVNRLRTLEKAEDAKEKGRPIWSLLKKLITRDGEICGQAERGGKTPKHHRARLRLAAAQLQLKLCAGAGESGRHFEEQLMGAEDFNAVAVVAQDSVPEVRRGFVQKLQKYLAEGKLRPRYYAIVFLTAFEPDVEFRTRVETWVRSRARHFAQRKQPVLEAVMARLLHLLAHHPDFVPEVSAAEKKRGRRGGKAAVAAADADDDDVTMPPEPEEGEDEPGSLDLADLKDQAQYLLYYISLVANEDKLGLIYKYAERVKQTQDALEPRSVRHRVLSDLAMTAARKWQERKGWVFNAYADKVGTPMGLYARLQSHAQAQQVAEKQYIPEGVDDKLDELMRLFDRKKKRKATDDGQPPAKKAKSSAKAAGDAAPGSTRKAAKGSGPSKRRNNGGGPPKTRRRAGSDDGFSSDGESDGRRDANGKSGSKTKGPKGRNNDKVLTIKDLADRRRSRRQSIKNKSYADRDDQEDEAEMMEGVAEWEYVSDKDDEEGEDRSSTIKFGGKDEGDQGSVAEDDEGQEEEVRPKGKQPAKRTAAKRMAPAKTPVRAKGPAKLASGAGDDGSELSDVDGMDLDTPSGAGEDGGGDGDEDADMGSEPSPPPPKAKSAKTGRPSTRQAAATTRAAAAGPIKGGAATSKSRPSRKPATREENDEDEDEEGDEDDGDEAEADADTAADEGPRRQPRKPRAGGGANAKPAKKKPSGSKKPTTAAGGRERASRKVASHAIDSDMDEDGSE